MAVPFMETLYTHVAGDLASKSDVLVWSLHTYLVHYGLKCVGSSDIKENNTASATEILPSEWKSQAPNVYTLQYVRSADDTQYVLKALSIGDQTIVNILRFGDNNVTTIQFDVDAVVSDDFQQFKTAFIDLESFKAQLESGLSIFGWFASKSENETGKRSDDSDLLENRPTPSSHGRSPFVGVGQASQPSPFDIGRSDLDPFAGITPGSGGGMYMRLPGPGPILDPSTGLPQRLPPGAVPPGARFDPFGPPGTGTGSAPGSGTGGPPDYLRPPPDDDY